MTRCIKYFLFWAVFFFGFVTPGAVFAQIPSNTAIPCNEVSSEEFHSLRPYQANVQCQSSVSELASFCGNNLTLTDNIEVRYPQTQGDCSKSGSNVICNYNLSIKKTGVTINLAGANLPILGNTEDVVNSQKKISDSIEATEGDFTNTYKMNNYVSWYLQGTLNRAEYPLLNVEDLSKIDVFSGPVNKLLPQDIQYLNRRETVINAAKTQHDQVVGCSLNITPSIFGVLGELFRVGEVQVVDIPYPCYTDYGWISKIIPNLTITQHRLSEWAKNLPPLRSEKEDYTEYLKALNEWRGEECAIIKAPDIIPLIGGKSFLLCVNNKFESKAMSYLFPYIPTSSTEDVEGHVSIEKASPDTIQPSSNVSLSNITFSNQSPASLFFPHVLETNETSSQLQDTFAPKGADKVGSPTDINSQISCNQLEVRSNKGDDLFATQIVGDLGYTARFSCSFSDGGSLLPATPNCAIVSNTNANCAPAEWSCSDSFGASDCGEGLRCGVGCAPPSQVCKKSVRIVLTTKSEIPTLDDLWSRLVAGPMSIVKRIFPKTNTPNGIGTIKDIPGSTNISYSGGGLETSDTDLKIPHVGGISEYFLKGIQTILRPKGFGEPVSFDLSGSGPQASCSSTFDINKLSSPTDTACKLCSANISGNLQKIIESAAQTFGVPGSVILGTMYHEGAFSRGLDWSDQNVIAWAACGATIPGCNKDSTSAQIPFGWIPSYFYGDQNLWSASSLVDPGRTKSTASPCNLLDGVFATAAALKMWTGGLPTSVKYPVDLDITQKYSQFPDFCYNWDLNNGSGAVSSCASWNENIVATSQVGYGGYCPEPGKHPTGSAFPDNNPFIQTTMSYYQQYTCK